MNGLHARGWPLRLDGVLHMTAKFSKSSAASLRSRASTRSVCGLVAVLLLGACGEAEEAVEDFYGYLARVWCLAKL